MRTQPGSGSLCFSLAAMLCLYCLGPRLAVGLEPDTALSQYSHRVWRFGDDGLLGTPQGVTQTPDGYIWVSTSNGLFRFDGVRFTKWAPLPGETLPSNSMWHVLGARNGSLYVGTDNGLARITNGHVFTYPGSPRWPGPFVQDRSGRVWAGVSGVHSPANAICRVLDTTLHCLGVADGFACSRGFANAVDAMGDLWIGSPEGACRWKPDTPAQTATLIPVPDGAGKSQVRSLAVTSEGVVYAGAYGGRKNSGLLRLEGDHWSPLVGPALDGSKLTVSALLATADGVLWIGTSDTGLYRLHDGRLEHFDLADGLSDRNVLSIFAGREGGIWVATPAAIEYFRDYAVASYTSRERLIEGHAIAVAADSRGNVFLGSSILIELHGSSRAQIKYPDGRPVEDVRTLYVDSHDNLWIAVSDALVMRDPDGGIFTVPAAPQDSDSIDYITEDRDHELWASGQNSRSHSVELLRLHEGRIVERYPVPPLLAGQVLNALAPNPAGGVWIGGSVHGLFWFHDGRFEQVDASGFNARVENLLQEPDGALWIVTQSGFVRYQDGHARRLDNQSGLPCGGGVDILDDGRGAKWFYLHCGIERVSDDELRSWWRDPSFRVRGRFFGPLEGARPNLSNGSPARTPDGHLWSASDYSFQSIDSLHLPLNSTRPGVAVERVAADGHFYVPGSRVTLPMNTRQIELDYTGLSFKIPEEVRFRYRLEGHDTDWVDANTRRQAFYNDLASGTYVFHVIACNNNGLWNAAGAVVTLVILPAWYQMWPFRAAAVGGVIAIAVLIYLYRLQSYAASLKRRFDERLRERTRLARDLHDTLLQTIQGSKLVADNAREHLHDPGLTGRSLDRLSDWLDRASIEGRAALEALRVSAVESDDLSATLRRAAEDCAAGTGFEIVVLSMGAARELHPIARDEVYRIAYEAIRNAVAHSGGRELRIEISYGGKFRLEVRDNGRGLDEATLLRGRPSHYGLAGMRERAAGAGGKLEIAASPGGTSVTLTIPGHAIYKQPYGFFARSRDRLMLRRRPKWS